ncbi:MAG: hypothetical protein G01um10143_217 [Parcubacteria group bacterium Gr01-1014_3]|nr:MAG: hypothetical protein G01um10143_217 [Parcubacteria group bacterium Gr01-1014_3]
MEPAEQKPSMEEIREKFREQLGLQAAAVGNLVMLACFAGFLTNAEADKIRESFVNANWMEK